MSLFCNGLLVMTFAGYIKMKEHATMTTLHYNSLQHMYACAHFYTAINTIKSNTFTFMVFLHTGE